MRAAVQADITTITDLALLRLCHLVSPALPVGAYAYSQGLEFAVHAGWVTDEATALDWLTGMSSRAVGSLDLPVLLRLHAAWTAGDRDSVSRWNAELLASRETAEARAEDRHLGAALARVLEGLNLEAAAGWRATDAAFATLFSLAAVHWRIDARTALLGYLWTWTENQVLAAIKLVPLGQSAGQRLLHSLTGRMPDIVAVAQTIVDGAIGIGVVRPALGSALHESQYTRLFRS
jgi:urease accessory protein